VAGLVRLEIVAMNRFERSFGHSLDRPHASYSRELAARRQDRPEVTVQ
jgi:hypothetical protein